jgi:NodT family efflux transporter outer membrane factor (OMF) lipoprotein
LVGRRPDIAASRVRVEAAANRIKEAKASFYPNISISALAGFSSLGLSSLFSAGSAFASVTPAITLPIFHGGSLQGQYRGRRGQYDEAVANYREFSLVAFQQVEDALSGLNALSAAYTAQIRAVDDAQRALALANARYTGGLVTYLDVITAQETLLSNERLSTQILGQRLTTSVLLVKALGGGWDSASLASVGIKPSLKQAIQQ